MQENNEEFENRELQVAKNDTLRGDKELKKSEERFTKLEDEKLFSCIR